MNNIVSSNIVNSNEHSNIETNNRYEIPGYDTICYRVNQFDVPEMDFMSELTCKLERRKEKYKPDGRIYLEGNIKELHLTIHESCVLIRVSLPLLLLGNNVESIFIDEVKNAHEKISKLLGFSIYKARVYRIDVAATFIMNNPFHEYLPNLGSLPRFIIENQDNGMYYYNCKKKKHSSSIMLLLYDKLIEQLEKGKHCNVGFQNSLRYEIRFRKFKRSLNRKEMFPIDLEDKVFFHFLFEKWKTYFNKIAINREINPNVDFLKNGKIFSNYFTSAGIKGFGEDKLLKFITNQMKQKIIAEQNGYRLKRKIKSLLNCDVLSEGNELIKELKKKVNG